MNEINQNVYYTVQPVPQFSHHIFDLCNQLKIAREICTKCTLASFCLSPGVVTICIRGKSVKGRAKNTLSFQNQNGRGYTESIIKSMLESICADNYTFKTRPKKKIIKGYNESVN